MVENNVGSSPRVRGAGEEAVLPDVDAGIIPARAGSSLEELLHGILERDHPRACGEQSAGTAYTTPTAGSSPRVRGAVHGWLLSFAGVRIIPARAGSRHS